MHPLALCVLVAALFAPLTAQPIPGELRTRPERTDWTETSRHADVTAFLSALKATPGGSRLRIADLGLSGLGRPIPIVAVAIEHPNPVKLLVIGDIHGGEVEGKEALQMLLRELTLGEHAELFKNVELYAVPVFNPDGNDLVDTGNRVSQNGPSGGVGQRANAQGLDLNRDFLKVESPEVRALVRAIDLIDPHVFIDLHTTNGSMHGYHLTYAPSCATSLDPALDDFTRKQLLASLRKAVEARHGYRTFDYGNFSRRGPLRWSTFSPDPRLAFNYVGLRNRISLLFEAYSYRDFRTRTLTTHACLLEAARFLSERADEVLALCEAADERTAGRVPGGDRRLHYDPEFVVSKGTVLRATVERVPWPDGRGARNVVKDDHEEVEADVAVAFRGKSSRAWPAGWAVRDAPESVVDALAVHGVRMHRVVAEARIDGDVFTVGNRSKSPRPFQGHRLVRLRGEYARRAVTLPAGTLIVPSNQRLARVAANLLSPSSDDSLVTWNFFDLVLGEGAEGTAFPVIGLTRLPELGPALEFDDEEDLQIHPFPPPLPVDGKAGTTLVVTNVARGTRRGAGGFERGARWQGRVTRWDAEDLRSTDLDGFAANLAARRDRLRRPLVLSVGPRVAHSEIRTTLATLAEAGIEPDHLVVR